MTTNASTIYTIGHSNLTIASFITHLNKNAINTLIDIRAWPHSKHHPQFNQDNLTNELQQVGLARHWAGRQLGGMRKPILDSVHLGLQGGMRGYADYMQSDEFKTGVAKLIKIAADSTVCLMCAEREPMDCHRSLLSDYLVLQGVGVQHINGVGQVSPHYRRPEARCESARLIYDRMQQKSLL